LQTSHSRCLMPFTVISLSFLNHDQWTNAQKLHLSYF
jgi:hypothetical protein